MSASFELNEDIIAEYETKGVVCLRNVFSREWVDSAIKGIEKNLLQPSQRSERLKGSEGPGSYFDDYCNWQRIDEFRDLAFRSPAAHIAAQLTRSKRVSFYHEHVLIKEPGTSKETPWHHDQSYYPIDGNKVCSIWMPVDPVPMDTCLQFVAGSHKWGWYFPRRFSTTLPYEMNTSASMDREYKPVPDIDRDREKYEILYWDVQPGDCIVFHMRTLHGAPGNKHTHRSRRILSTRWLGDDATIAQRPWRVSPPTYGGLNFGDLAISDDFPLIWEKLE